MDDRSLGVISVDKWTTESEAYFLTHLHSDHTSGLSSKWRKGPLYCSRLTAKLFPFKFPHFDLSLLRILDLNLWHPVPVPVSSTVHVMAIDAHHCPGAVMFLFRGEFGCLLYTGDFRWEPGSERAIKGRHTLSNTLKDYEIDILYVDNTFCNPSYSFPSRDFAAQKVVEIIASHPEHDIIIGIDSLGKEDLLLHVAHTLKIKIWVWPERLQTMHLLGFDDEFTTKTSLTRVRAVPRYSFSIQTLEELNTMQPTIGIMPSGLPWVVKPNEGIDRLSASLIASKRNKQNANSSETAVERFHRYIYSVPYSDHSCFEEIEEFVKLVQPSNIKGIVSSSSCYVDPLYYFGRLCSGNLPSQKLQCMFSKKEAKQMEAQSKPKCKSPNSSKAKIKRGRTAEDFWGVYVSRISALRRVRRGAKIMEKSHPD